MTDTTVALEHSQALDQFFTRPALAKAIVEWADIQPGDRVLEPSCGAGDLVRWIPREAVVHAMDIDREVFAFWDEECRSRVELGVDTLGDFLKRRAPSDAYDKAVMNPPYGYVGRGKARQAADRLHVQHALRMAPDVIVHARANFLFGSERYQHIFRFARLVKMAVLVHRPSYHGPAVAVDGSGGQHEMAVFHLQRRPDRELSTTPECEHDQAQVEFWTQDWRIDP